MKKYLNIIKNSPLFAGIPEDGILSIISLLDGKKLTYSKDEYVLHRGDTTDELGLILYGSVLIIQEDVWGRRNIMDKIPSGNIFAETFAVCSQYPLNVSVVCDQNCTILFLNVNRLLTLFQKECNYHSCLIYNLMSILANKNIRFNNKLTHMSKKTTREKLMSFLSSQAIQGGSLEFDIEFDRQQLADYLCVERAAMSVELSSLQKDGFIIYKKNHFLLNSDLGEFS